jgi:hypothetical protein
MTAVNDLFRPEITCCYPFMVRFHDIKPIQRVLLATTRSENEERTHFLPPSHCMITLPSALAAATSPFFIFYLAFFLFLLSLPTFSMADKDGILQLSSIYQ